MDGWFRGAGASRAIVFFIWTAAVLTVLAVPPVWGQVGAANSPYGLCAHAPHSSFEQAEVDKMMDAGVDWIRIDFVWEWVEPSQNSFNWSVFDSIANYVQSRSRPLHVLANLQKPPAWAVKAGEAGVLNNTADLTDVLTRAVQRYQGVIDYWGLYNEPDFDSNWTGSRGEYIDQILKPGADAIHAARPGAKVVGPELSHLGSHEWYYWLKDSLEQAGDKIDIVSHHTYADSHSTHNSRLNGNTWFGDNPDWWGWINPSLREVLEYTGWDGPVWLTETGWNSDKSGGQQWQADRLSEFLEDWFGDSPNEDDWLEKVFIYEMSDDPGKSTKGLLEADSTPKLAYHTYADFIAANPVPEPAEVFVGPGSDWNDDYNWLDGTSPGNDATIDRLYVKNGAAVNHTALQGFTQIAGDDSQFFLGRPGGGGTINLSGGILYVNSQQDPIIGNTTEETTAVGVLNISATGVFVSERQVILGDGAAGLGIVVLSDDGQAVINDFLVLGNDGGSGYVILSDNGSLTTDGLTFSNGWISFNSQGNAGLTVTGRDRVYFENLVGQQWIRIDNAAVAGPLDDYFQVDQSTLTLQGPPIPGDANRDGCVDYRDASLLAQNWQTQTGATWGMGDFSGDGKVTDTDASVLATHWQECPASGAAAVPEPSGIVLLGLLLLGGLILLRPRCRTR